MTVYNAARYLPESLDSILHQTFGDFEFLIINDGSADESSDILRRYARTDRRIRLWEQSNEGIAAARNRGMELATAALIAIADADDVCLPERLARQVAFLEAHPAVGVCGTWIETFGEQVPPGGVNRFPLEDAVIKAALLFEPMLSHPSSMIRRALLNPGVPAYDAAFRMAHDYDLWVRLARTTAFANLPEVLVRYRRHPTQITHRHGIDGTGLQERQQIWAAQLRGLGLSPGPEELRVHEMAGAWHSQFSRSEVEQIQQWLQRLACANTARRQYPEPAFSRMLGIRWYWVCSHSARYGAWAGRTFWASPLAPAAALNPMQRLKFALKCRLRRCD